MRFEETGCGHFLTSYILVRGTNHDPILCNPGPYSLNGVPLRRVNQRYVIATSTKIDLSTAVKNSIAKIDDSFFAREKAAKPAEEVRWMDRSRESGG